MWIHSASMPRAMWLFGLLLFACMSLSIALMAVLWRGRRRDFALRPLPPDELPRPDMESVEHTEARWQTFRSQPAAGVHPRRIVQAFDGLISDDVASKLVEDGRFRHRLSALLAEIYELSNDFGDDPPSDQSRRMALASSSDLMSRSASSGRSTGRERL